jgi:hypothetical protein
MVKKENSDGNQSDKVEPADQHGQTRQVRFVEEGVKTNYSNVFNIGFGQEEVIFIFGNRSVDPNVVRIESKMAVSIKTAKRIAITLGSLLRRYEAIHGEVDISAPKAPEEKAHIQ